MLVAKDPSHSDSAGEDMILRGYCDWDKSNISWDDILSGSDGCFEGIGMVQESVV